MKQTTQTNTDSNRMRHCITMWEEYCADDSYPQCDRWLASRLKRERSFGKKDRRWYSDTFFAAVRHALFASLYAHSHRMTSDKSPDEIAEILIQSAKAVHGWDDIRRLMSQCGSANFMKAVQDRNEMHEGTPLNALRKALYSAGMNGVLLWNSFPQSHGTLIDKRAALSSWDKDAVKQFITSHETRPPLWIRFNKPAESQTIINTLRDTGFSVQLHDGIAELSGGKSLYDAEAYKKGLIEIQDCASQQIGIACDVHPGMYVWDACAGGGGKTLQIASLLESKGAVYASDIRDYKLEETKLRARRGGFSNVRTLAWNGAELPLFPKEVNSRGGFHRVLVDAPCSSSGTWRRNPDGKYRVTSHDLAELTILQLSILEKASHAVRNDGLLIYATCSFIEDENESVIEAFLKGNESFSLVQSSMHGNPVLDSDATFTAVMKRK